VMAVGSTMPDAGRAAQKRWKWEAQIIRNREGNMQARLLFQRFSRIATIAKAAFTNSAVQSAVPTAAYVQHLLRSPLYFVLKAVGPAMAPAINDGVAERAVGNVRASDSEADVFFDYSVFLYPI
jgi:hypothetical protein